MDIADIVSWCLCHGGLLYYAYVCATRCGCHKVCVHGWWPCRGWNVLEGHHIMDKWLFIIDCANCWIKYCIFSMFVWNWTTL